MYRDLIAVIIGAGLLFAVIGLYLIIKAWFSLTRTPDDIVRAKAFLDLRFLRRNFLLIFILSFFVAMHLFLEFIDVYGLPPGLEPYWQQIGIFYTLLPTTAMFLLVLLAIYWRRLLRAKK